MYRHISDVLERSTKLLKYLQIIGLLLTLFMNKYYNIKI